MFFEPGKISIVVGKGRTDLVINGKTRH